MKAIFGTRAANGTIPGTPPLPRSSAASLGASAGTALPLTPKSERLLGTNAPATNEKRLSASSEHLRAKLRMEEAERARKKKVRGARAAGLAHQGRAFFAARFFGGVVWRVA